MCTTVQVKRRKKENGIKGTKETVDVRPSE